jgi:hypothetical protein
MLDEDFFNQVYDWNENTLDRILNDIYTGPIPFRGFVKTLAHLVKQCALCNLVY